MAVTEVMDFEDEMDKLPGTLSKQPQLTTCHEVDEHNQQIRRMSLVFQSEHLTAGSAARHYQRDQNCSQGSASLVMFDAFRMEGSGTSHFHHSGTNVFAANGGAGGNHRAPSSVFLESQLSDRRPSQGRQNGSSAHQHATSHDRKLSANSASALVTAMDE